MKPGYAIPLAVIAAATILGGALALEDADTPADAAPPPAGHADTQQGTGGKGHARLWITELHLPLPDRISATGWIIEGRLLNGTGIETWSDGFVSVHTVYAVEVVEVLRGNIDEKIITVGVPGGETARYSVLTDRHEMLPGEHFIMFLGRGSCESRHLSDFRVAPPGGGLYLIDGGIARNIVESESLPVDDLRWEIAWLAWMPRTDVPGVIKRPCADPAEYEAAYEAEALDGRMRSLWPFENATHYGSVEEHMDEIRGLPEVEAFHAMYEGHDIVFSDRSTSAVRFGYIANDGDRSAYLVIGYYNREPSSFLHACVYDIPYRSLFVEDSVKTDCFSYPDLMGRGAAAPADRVQGGPDPRVMGRPAGEPYTAEGDTYIHILADAHLNMCEECPVDAHFDKAHVAAPRGARITWSNDSPASHTLEGGMPHTGPDGSFSTGLLMPGEKYTLDTIWLDTGYHGYYCTVHPWEQGWLEVRWP